MFFATPTRTLAPSPQPPGFSACDLQPARPRRRRRNRGAGAGEEGDRSDDDKRSDDEEWEDDEHLDGIYGDPRAGDHSDEREWEQYPTHDWSNDGWIEQAQGQSTPDSWIRDKLREGAAEGAETAAAKPPTISSKQTLTVDVVGAHQTALDDHRAAVAAEEPATSLLFQTRSGWFLQARWGQGKKEVVADEIGKERFKLMAPTGCAACGIGGQVWCESGLFFSQLSSPAPPHTNPSLC